MLRATTSLAVLGGLLLSTFAVPDLARAEAPACEDPNPCEYVWQGPAGPAAVGPAERVRVDAHDGVDLNGWLFRPTMAEPTLLPTILIASPYVRRGTVPSRPPSVGGVSGSWFVEQGYAVAIFSVRGTGDSGGCFANKSLDEQRDQVDVVEWLAERPWSNGRIGMVGLSYPGTTPVMAAIQQPPALKTIVIGGTILDEYGFLHTPQGAQFFEGPLVPHVFTADSSLAPATPPGDPQHEAVLTERVCEELVELNTVVHHGNATGDRGAEFWTDRRFIDRVPDIRAATFVVHGFEDRYGSGHAFQDDWAWEALVSAPKRMLLGQWRHEWPNRNSVHPEWSLEDWPEKLRAWLDYWLKGHGDEAPGLGTVEFEDGASGEWRRSTAWPPPLEPDTNRREAASLPAAAPVRRSDEVLYLSDRSLQPVAAAERSSFLSSPPPPQGGSILFATDPVHWRWTSPCPDPTRLTYLSAPVDEPTLLAGNPFVWLDLESSAPGGLIEVQLYDVPPTFDCTDRAMTGLQPLTEGSADLSFHASDDYRRRPFPIGEPTHVRIDLPNLAYTLEPGHRLAAVLSHGVYYRWTAHEYVPLLTVHGDATPGSSHLVAPVVSGGFGGEVPTLDYPPRPFSPNVAPA